MESWYCHRAQDSSIPTIRKLGLATQQRLPKQLMAAWGERTQLESIITRYCRHASSTTLIFRAALVALLSQAAARAWRTMLLLLMPIIGKKLCLVSRKMVTWFWDPSILQANSLIAQLLINVVVHSQATIHTYTFSKTNFPIQWTALAQHNH